MERTSLRRQRLGPDRRTTDRAPPCRRGRSDRSPTRLVELGDRERGRRIGRLDESAIDAVEREPFEELASEAVGRESPEVGRRAAEPPDRPGGVERTAARDGGQPSAGIDEEVDQALAADDDHPATTSIGVVSCIAGARGRCRLVSAGGPPDERQGASRRAARRSGRAGRQPARPAPDQPRPWRRADQPAGGRSAAERGADHLDASRHRSSTSARAARTSLSRCWRTPGAAVGSSRWSPPMAGPRSSTRRASPGRPSRTSPASRSMWPMGGPSPPRPFVRHRPCIARRPSLPAGRCRRDARGDGPGRPPRDRRQRPGPRAAALAGGLARRPPADREPLHPSRRAAVGPSRLHGRRCGSCLPERACVRSASSAGSSVIATRSRRSGHERRRRDRRRRSGRGRPRDSPGQARASGRPVRALAGLSLAGVRRFSSPASADALRAAGLDGETLAGVARPAPAMRLETASGTQVRLTYGDDGSLAAPAVSFDRAALDPALLDLARRAGRTSGSEPPPRRRTRPDRRPGRRRRDRRGGPRHRRCRRDPLDRRPSVRRRPVAAARGRVGLTFHVADPGRPSRATRG